MIVTVATNDYAKLRAVWKEKTQICGSKSATSEAQKRSYLNDKQKKIEHIIFNIRWYNIVTQLWLSYLGMIINLSSSRRSPVGSVLTY